MTAPASREPQVPDVCPDCGGRWMHSLDAPEGWCQEIDEAEAGLRSALTPALTVAMGLWGAVILVLWVAFG